MPRCIVTICWSTIQYSPTHLSQCGQLPTWDLNWGMIHTHHGLQWICCCELRASSHSLRYVLYMQEESTSAKIRDTLVNIQTPSARNLDVPILVTSQNSVNCQTYWWYDIRNAYWTINEITMISFSQMGLMKLPHSSRNSLTLHDFRPWKAMIGISAYFCRTLNSVSQHKNITATQQHLMNTYPYHACCHLLIDGHLMPELEIWALTDAHMLQSLNCHLLRITWTPLICTNIYPPRPCKYVLHWMGSHGPIVSSHNYSPRFKDHMVRSKTNNHERDIVLCP